MQGVKTIFPLPDGLTFDEGAVIDPASIALHVANRGDVAPGDTVAITGAGADRPAGRRRGAHPWRRAGSSSSSGCRAGWRRLPRSASRRSTRATGDPVATVRAMTGGLGADVVLECAGVPVTVQWALGMLRRGGRCAAVGIPTVGVEIAMQKLVLDELELVGSRASAGEMRRVMPLVEQGRMRVPEVMTHRFALADYQPGDRHVQRPRQRGHQDHRQPLSRRPGLARRPADRDPPKGGSGT